MLAAWYFVLLPCVVVLLIKYIWQYINYRKTMNLLPGKNNLSFIKGDLEHFPGFSEDGLMFDFECVQRFKYFHRTWLGPFLSMVQVYHPDTLREVIKTTSSKPRQLSVTSSYDMALPWLGEGLILTNGDRWYRNRRLLTPAFHFDILKSYMCVYNACSSLLHKKIREHSDVGKSFDIHPLISKYTLDVLLRCAFSYQSNCQMEAEPGKYAKTIAELQQLFSVRVLNPLFYSKITYILTSQGRRFYKLCDIAHQEAETIIKKRKEELTSNSESTSKRKYRDFLDTMITATDENGNGLSDLEIRNEVDTFLFAGHDTTASGILWTLLALAQHPEHQDIVYNEVMTVLEDGDRVLSWEDLTKLQYTSQCIKEALRLHSAVPMVERMVTGKTVLNGYEIPVGTRVTLHLWNLHHNPHIWEDPHDYQPSRFHPDNVVNMDPFQFIPFSAGSRNCIGQNFAMNEMKVTVAEIVKHFKLSADSEKPAQREVSITMKASDGAFVYATPR